MGTLFPTPLTCEVPRLLAVARAILTRPTYALLVVTANPYTDGRKLPDAEEPLAATVWTPTGSTIRIGHIAEPQPSHSNKHNRRIKGRRALVSDRALCKITIMQWGVLECSFGFLFLLLPPSSVSPILPHPLLSTPALLRSCADGKETWNAIPMDVIPTNPRRRIRAN